MGEQSPKSKGVYSDTAPGARDVPARSSHGAANAADVFARAKPSRTRCGPGRPALRFSCNVDDGLGALIYKRLLFFGPRGARPSEATRPYAGLYNLEHARL